MAPLATRHHVALENVSRSAKWMYIPSPGICACVKYFQHWFPGCSAVNYTKIIIQYEQTLVYEAGFCRTKPQFSVTSKHSTKPVKMFEHNGHLHI
jgi:hypothetical protein